MSSAQSACPECGAALVAGQDRCWLCQRQLEPHDTANPYVAPQPVPEASAAQFSLESLFLLTTLVAVGLGVFLIAPGLGVLFALVTVPAFARTWIAGYRDKQAGLKLTVSQKISAFILSFLLMLAIGFAGCIAFFFVCTGTGLAALAIGADDEGVLIFIFGASSLAALALAGFLMWVSWPRRLQTLPKQAQP